MDHRLLDPAPQAPTPEPQRSLQPAMRGARAGTLHITSERLFGGAGEVQIEHNGAVYRLKHTSLGKLILTK